MLRRQARLRREYLYRKSLEARRRKAEDSKEKIRHALQENIKLPTDLRKKALAVQASAQWDDDGPSLAEALNQDGSASGIDDEYRWAGVEDPKIMVTTSREPSSRLKMFVKEIRLLFPTAQRMNRGNYEMKQLVEACRANNVTDFIIVHEHRGVPDGLIICHLPYGPTARFNISDVVMRHDIPDIKTVSEQYPHLIFHNFQSKLGQRVQNILKYLFPVPKEESRRVMTFINHDDNILFRHHVYKKTDRGKNVELDEVGPRFTLKLYEIKLGTIDQGDAAMTEWVYRPYLNTARKRFYLSEAQAWS